MSKRKEPVVAKGKEEAAKRSRLEDDRSDRSPANRPAPSAASAVPDVSTAEHKRLTEGGSAWKQWGPYLAERQWGTVREDKSEDGSCWESFTHDEAAFRAYTSGEDGLLGICDDRAQLCQAVALWNGVDIGLKERFFGLTGPQIHVDCKNFCVVLKGNHGEDVKEVFYYVDSTPTHSYMRALYKYPQVAFPYNKLILDNAARTREEPEYEILDTGVFDQNRYWDVVVEYAKSTPHDILCQYSVHNRGPDSACLHILPMLWYRNTWFKQEANCSAVKPVIKVSENLKHVVCSGINSLGQYVFAVDAYSPQILFTNNETNVQKMNTSSGLGEMPDLTNVENHFKDAFHDFVIHGNQSAKQLRQGTKCAFHFTLQVPPGSMHQIRCRLYRRDEEPCQLFGKTFDDIINQRLREADEFYSLVIPGSFSLEEKLVTRQAYAGLCWSKQFYYFDGHSIPNDSGEERRNSRWRHMLNNDVISMPDKWEFPWYAWWDIAFHMIPFADIDLDFAKSQLLLALNDRYQHPNGQLPGCEFQFDDAHPPVHAWSCLHIARKSNYRLHGNTDIEFLKKCFHKLVINFNWWMNQKDVHGRYLFSGGFLGMDNISAVDRSVPPEGTVIEQADGTAWMAFYARCMMEIALELSGTDCSYQDLAVTYLHHFVSITKALNSTEFGLWDEDDGFYYDRLILQDSQTTKMLHIRSLVGLVSLFPVLLLNSSTFQGLEMFKDELEKSVNQLQGIQHFGQDNDLRNSSGRDCYLLSLVSYSQLKSLLQYVFDETEFLSPFGIRSLSKIYAEDEYSVDILGNKYTITYCPSESNSDLFGGNSNWRGPVWLCMNFLLLEALDCYGNYFGTAVNFEYPKGSKVHLPLHDITLDIRQRIAAIFLPDDTGVRPLNGDHEIFTNDYWKGMVHFYEFFNPETGKGLGACHQTGWTALIASILQHMAAKN